jgi:hypothetical protein
MYSIKEMRNNKKKDFRGIESHCRSGSLLLLALSKEVSLVNACLGLSH